MSLIAGERGEHEDHVQGMGREDKTPPGRVAARREDTSAPSRIPPAMLRALQRGFT